MTHNVEGIPGTAMQLSAGQMLMRRLSFAGSLIGGIKDTQEVIDLCKNILFLILIFWVLGGPYFGT